MSESEGYLPVSFRRDLMERLAPSLLAGECCSLIGVSGVGKSNLARFLCQPDVQATYFADDHTWMVLVDSHSIVYDEQPTEFVVLELMIHRLIREVETRSFTPEFVTWATDLYTHLVEHPNAHVAFRYLERLCARLCKQYGLRLIFVFDQFDDLWQRDDVRIYLNLRNLRDQFKYQVVYLVITRHRLRDLRKDITQVEAFWELFSAHTFGLPMYSSDDARHMLERIASRASISLTETLREQLMYCSGRHPGLLRATFWSHEHSSDTDDPTSLAHVAAITEECAKVWTDLTPNEQHLVRAVACDNLLGQPDSETLISLRLKGIVLESDPLMLFSPMFAHYVVQHSVGPEDGVIVDVRLRQVRLNGKALDRQLGPLEFTLIEYLARHAGSVCPTEDILHHLYPSEGYYSDSDQRLDAILSRLREALGEDGRNPRYVVRHRKAGIQLTRGGTVD